MTQQKHLKTASRSRQPDKTSISIKVSPQKYALISVSDKTGIVEIAKALSSLGYLIISTGGSSKVLTANGIPIIPIQNITGNPESFDGRMKTISFQIEGGILFDRTNSTHIRQALELGIKPIDIVVCNLYPFEQTIRNPETTIDQAVENIDVGGPTMVRAAAKNFKNVLVITDPNDYQKVLKILQNNSVTTELRQTLAAKAFAHLSFYDAQIARYLKHEPFPEEITIPGRKSIHLRQGENPHQNGYVYFEPNTDSPLNHLQKLTGRDLSYVNFTDINAGLESVRMFEQPASVIIKHNSPCGIALGNTLEQSLRRAVAADPESAFGGVIVLNRCLDMETAKTFSEFKEENGVLIDIVAAPAITEEAKVFIRSIRKSTGIYTFGEITDQRLNSTHVRFFDGGFLLQNWDDQFQYRQWKIVTQKKPNKKQLEQMRLAWKFISRIRSNSVIIVDKQLPMTRGIGSGQTSRIRATKIALEQAGKNAEGAILASDSFFPFDDSVKLAAQYGIAAIVQQGGSINDQTSIDAANKAGIAMILTGERKFWH